MQIKKQALDLIYKITNGTNVKSVAKELINYLLSADNEFKKELANKICQICEKYAPNKKWHIDTVIKVLTLTQAHTRENYISQIITVIATTPELHQYSVAKVFHAVKDNFGQTGLVQLAVWLIGEFGEMLVNGTCKAADGSPMVLSDGEILSIYERVLTDYSNPKAERGEIIIMWSLTALSKLSIRLGQAGRGDWGEVSTRILNNLKKYQGHPNVEIQQRSVEFIKIVGSEWDAERASIFEPMPFKGDENMLVDAKDRAAVGGDDDADEPDSGAQAAGGDGDVNNLLMLGDASMATGGANAGGGGGLLDLDMMMGGTGAPETKPGQDMMDLLGAGTSMPAAGGAVDLLGGLGAMGGAPPMQQPGMMAQPQTDIFGGGAPASNPFGGNDLLGGGAPAMGGDLFGVTSSGPAFPAFVAYEDNVIALGFDMQRDMSNNHEITAVFKNKTAGPLSNVSVQVAAQKYMTLKMQAASGTTLNPNSQDLTVKMNVTNSMEGQKPLSFKLKICYAEAGGNVVTQIKVVNCP